MSLAHRTRPHPLSATGARLRRRTAWVTFGFRGDGVPRGEPVPPWGGFRYGAIRDPVVMDRALALLAADVGQRPGLTGTAAVLLIGWASRIWLAAFLVDRRVPLATLAEATTDPAALTIDGSVVLPHGRFACLPGDPASSHRDALVVPDPGGLQRVFHEVVTDALVQPLIEGITMRGLIGRKALAGMVGSRWASTASLVARGPVERARMTAETTAVIGAHAVSRPAPPVFYEVPRGGGRALVHWRGTCCLYYQLPDGEKCAGACPLTPEGRLAIRVAADGS